MTCSKCAERERYRRSSWCSACHAEYQREYRKKNADKCRSYSRKSYAKHRDDRLAHCRERYWQNLEESRAYGRDKAKRNRHRYLVRLAAAQRGYAARKLSAGHVTIRQWTDILELYDWRCAYCLCALEHPEMDHLRPLSRGGLHEPDNVVPACRTCNSSKRDALVFVWLPRLTGAEKAKVAA